MTDKQIIIDGVDVHWCEHYTGNIGYLTDKNWTCRAKIQGTKCEDWSNCYFKRWQRKEQECDMWKNLTVDNGAVALKYQQQLDQLKAENEDLKIYIESNEQQVKEVETLVMDKDRLINELDQLKEQLEAYKMEAEEGKEINAELKAENDDYKERFDKLYSFNKQIISENFKLGCQCVKLKQTLTEIKEIAEDVIKNSIYSEI